MKLTHHSTPSRSFVLLTIIVLCTVYAALVLSRINRLYVEAPAATQPIQAQPDNQPTQTSFRQVEAADTTRWNEFKDQDYPLTFLRPQGWNVTWNDDVPDLYVVSVTRSNPRAQIKIYLSKIAPAAPQTLSQANYTTANGYLTTNFNNLIYQTKVGEYYYVFDGTDAGEYLPELAGLVNSVRLD